METQLKVDDLSQEFAAFQKRQNLKKKAAQEVGAVVGLGALGYAIVPRPAKAEGIADVTAMITSLGGIAAAVTTVVLVGMGVRMAIKIVNRVAVKG